MLLDVGLRLIAVWADVDLIQLRVYGSNGLFSGTTSVYVGHGQLAEAAALLAGVPASLRDRREVTLGSFGADSAGGAVGLSFQCSDGAGHVVVHIVIESDPVRGSTLQLANFLMAVEPAAIDVFASELLGIDSSRKGTAWLRGMPAQL
jgi:hypothetical protein